MPKTRKPTDDEITRIQAESNAVECGVFKGKILIDDNSGSIARASEAAYNRFVREAGYEHDARIREWKKLDGVHQKRWVAIARAVIQASRSESQRDSSRDVPHNDVRTRRLRHRVGKAKAKVSSVRNRVARRG